MVKRAYLVVDSFNKVIALSSNLDTGIDVSLEYSFNQLYKSLSIAEPTGVLFFKSFLAMLSPQFNYKLFVY
nr:MAG TPA: hypothetical protein [Caudoviricetes sp.]